MYCPKCGTRVPDGSSHCGRSLGGFLAAIVWDWFVMTWFVEMLGLWVGMANDMKKLAVTR